MTSYQSGMKVPIRPAPPPPVNQHERKGISTFSSGKDIRNKSNGIPKKKPPPPRPPPPKFTNKRQLPMRPSQLITNLFQKKNHSSSKVIDAQIRSNTDLESKNNVLTLIDFNSPPSSPTFTRSSSDALSVNSFGSDGVTPCSTSSGNTSNVESGFEDDFDFFSSSSSSSSLNKNNTQKDSWDVRKNPSPLAFPPSQTKRTGWVTFTSNNSSKVNENVSAMPTIIRVKPERPKPPSIQKTKNITPSHIDLLTDVFENVHLNSNTGLNDPGFGYTYEDDDEEWSSSESPPMPTCPPPAPPPEILNGLLSSNDAMRIELPKPYGIALYDYTAPHADDLSFKEKDVINLVRRIDENWYLGEKNGRQGSVPVNFISVKVPIPDDALNRYVTALYTFTPETWEDLDFQEGSIIKVLSRIDQDWLYGECDGKQGQFPANFVDRIPDDLPIRRN